MWTWYVSMSKYLLFSDFRIVEFVSSEEKNNTIEISAFGMLWKLIYIKQNGSLFFLVFFLAQKM